MTNQRMETARLTLRRWLEDDRAAFAAICADAEVMRYIRDGATKSAEEAARGIEAFEREWDERGYGLFAIELRETSQLIGFAGLSQPSFLPEILPAAEIGWRIAREHWGQGYATEAARAVLEFAVLLPVEESIVSICYPENRASVRIMEKLGMTFDRRLIYREYDRQVLVYRLPMGS